MLLCNGARDTNVRPEPARALAARLGATQQSTTSGVTVAACYLHDGRFVHREWDVPHFVPPEAWSEMLEAARRFVDEWTRSSPSPGLPSVRATSRAS